MIELESVNKDVFNKLESPIEVSFYNQISRFLEPDIKVDAQVEIETERGNFRVDFLIKAPDGNILVIECDGEGFHNYVRDEWRDTFILSTKKVNIIYRISGHDIYTNRYDHLYLLYKFHPSLFSNQGIIEICNNSKQSLINESYLPQTPRSESVTDIDEYTSNTSMPDEYLDSFDDSEHMASKYYNLRTRGSIIARVGVSKYKLEPFGIKYYKYAKSFPHLSLDELIQQYEKENPTPNNSFSDCFEDIFGTLRK